MQAVDQVAQTLGGAINSIIQNTILDRLTSRQRAYRKDRVPVLHAPVMQSNQKWSKLVLLGCFLIMGSGYVTSQTNLPPSESQLSLIEARKARSDPKLATGLYLDAVDAALRSIR
jgi:hypothetical protein